jgi:hypothetical protein
MTDFEATWRLVRGRFDEAVAGLSQEQLNWRLQPDALTLGEMAVHVAGVEVSFVSQLLQSEPDEFGRRISAASTDGVVNEKPFPFTPDEITPAMVTQALELGRKMAESVVIDPDPIRDRQIRSALGPMVDGTGALARLAYHPGYHQGQAQLIKTAPGFPQA